MLVELERKRETRASLLTIFYTGIGLADERIEFLLSRRLAGAIDRTG